MAITQVHIKTITEVSKSTGAFSIHSFSDRNSNGSTTPSIFKSQVLTEAKIIDNVEGKDVIVVDDMISSGDSIIDVCRQLKGLKAKRIFVFATFGLFTSGLERFDEAYKEGLFNKIFTTNLIYTPEALLEREWHGNVDMSKYCAFIIDTLNHDESVSTFLDPVQKINDYMEKYNLK